MQELRHFLESLKKENYLLEVPMPLEEHYATANILVAAGKLGKTVLFPADKQQKISLVGGVLSSRKQVSLALSCEEKKIGTRFLQGLAGGIAPEECTHAPCQEKELPIQLTKLPVLCNHPLDTGAFITAGIVASKSLTGGAQNLSFQRMQVLNDQQLSIMPTPGGTVANFLAEARKLRRNLPVAICLGAAPAVYLAAAMKYPGDELYLAGELLQEAVKVTKAKNSSLNVPANAEIIIEGEILFDSFVEEASLTDFLGKSSSSGAVPRLQVTSISSRANPIFQTIIPGSEEHLLLAHSITREPLIWQAIAAWKEYVQDVSVPTWGSGFVAIVQVATKEKWELVELGKTVLRAHRNVRLVFLVGLETSIAKPEEMLKLYCSAEREHYALPKEEGHPMDPTALQGVVTKEIIISKKLISE